MLAVSEATVEEAILGLLLVCLVAAVVYFTGKFAGRPDVGAAGAALVGLVGGLLVLLDAL